MDKIILTVKTTTTKFKLLYLQLRKDGSFYIFFPRKNGYLIKYRSNIDDFSKGEKKIILKRNIKKTIINPYISFHPGKNTIHINAKNENGEEVRFLSDRFTEKISDILEKGQFIPFTSILFPNDIKVFDETVNENKNRIEFKLADHIQNPEYLNLEIFIHGTNGYLSADELKFKEKRKVVKIIPIYNRHPNAQIEASLVFSAIPPNQEGKKTKEIVSFIWNKEKPFVFCLEPINKS